MAVLFVGVAILVLVGLQNLVYAKLWNKNTKVDISFSQKDATEGTELELLETVSNAKVLPLPWVIVKFQVSRNLVFDKQNSRVSDDYYRNDMFSILSYQRITRRHKFTCARRGVYTIKSVDITSGNLLLSQKLVGHMACDAMLTVYPRHVDIDENMVPFNKMLGEVLARRFIQPDPFEFKGIREYQPYDSFKSINFKATAKAGKLMVNENDFTVSQRIILLLNLEPYTGIYSDALFEMGIRMAASIAGRVVAEGVPLRFVTNGSDLVSGQGTDLAEGSGEGHVFAVYEALARIDLKQPAEPFAPVLRQVARNSEVNTAYILVSTYDRDDIQKEFNRLRDTGAQVMWILPCFEDLKLNVAPDGDIVRWVVAANEQSVKL